VFGPEHRDVATSLSNLALMIKDQGKLAEATPYDERALRIKEKALKTNDPDLATVPKQRG
jgi:hypothetical protein